MNKVFIRLILCSCFVGGVGVWMPAYPQQKVLDVPTTLKGAIETVLLVHPEIRLAEAQIAKARAKIKEARGAFYPSLDLFVNTERVKVADEFSGVKMVGIFGEQTVDVSFLRNVPTYQINSNFNASLNFYSGGLHVAHFADAIAGEKEIQSHYSITKKKLILEVITAYGMLCKAQIERNVALRAEKVADQEALVSAEYYREGHLSEIDLTMKLLNAEEKKVISDYTQRIVKERLEHYITLLGFLQYDSVSPEIEQFSCLVDELDPINIEDMVRTYIEDTGQKLELIKYQAKIKMAEARAKAIRSGLYPKVDLFYRYTVAGRDQNSMADVWSDIDVQEWSIGLSLTWNLFNGFQTLQRITQAKLNALIDTLQLEQARKEFLDAQREKTLSVQIIKNDISLLNSQIKIEEQKERIDQRRLNMHEISQLDYDKAKIKVMDLYDKITILKIDLFIASAALLLV